MTRLQSCALALVVTSIGTAAVVGALTSSTLSQFTVSVLLGVVIWKISPWLLRAWRGAVTHPGPRSYRLVPALLLLAVAVSLLWHVGVRPGSWRYALVVAVAVGLAGWKPAWLERRTAAFGHVPAGTRAIIGLLLLLNILLMLALLDTARLSRNFWGTHALIAFGVMFCVDALLLKTSRFASAHEVALTSRSYLLTSEVPTPEKTAGPSRGGRVSEERGPAGPELASQAPTVSLPAKPSGRRRLRRPHSRVSARKAFAVVSVALAVGWIGYAHPGPVVILGVLVPAAAVLSMMDVSRQQAITMLLAIGTGVATVDYLSWRFAVTNWQGWWIAGPLLLAEALGAVHTLGFQSTAWPRPIPVIEPAEDPTQHAIFILVPTANEGAAILRPTLDGCIAARQKYLAHYPHGQVTIVVCNDGRTADYPRWAEIDTLAQELGVSCVTRSSGGGAKAGNIENARQVCGATGNSFVVIFDADQVAKPDFFLKTIPPFADTKVGWVQTGQYYANLNNPVSRWADDQQSMFYNVLCPGKAAVNAAFICGTNVVIRAAALDEIGGLPQDSVTEDFAASIVIHSRWRSIYLSDVLATGLGPLDIPSYLKQQGRWALGTLSVCRDHWRDILLPKKNGLRFEQRVQYFLACTHYLCGLRDLIYLLSPILFIFTGIPAVHTATLSNYLWYFLPYCAFGMAGMWYATQGLTGLRGVIIGFGSSPALIGSLIAAVLRRKKPFAVTSKEVGGRRSLRYLGSYVFFLSLCVFAFAWATQVKGRQTTSIFISLLWLVYSIMLLSSFLWLALADLRAHRAEAAEITGKQAYPAKLLTQKKSIKPVLNLGLAALIAGPVLIGARLAGLPLFGSLATPFVVTQQQVDARYTGLTLPVQSLTSQPPVLERDLGIRFSIIGRTQDINDQFDAAWADQLASQGARPWVILEMGTFGSTHEPSLTAGLPAIYNGVDDSALTRWATEIRDFGKPVYLTVLLQADKNWSISSGVANGGIPEDAPKAWLHIQSVFRAAGAKNVAWVWAPADPAHDQQFAPPSSTIDVVLQDFINYPGTRWRDPKQVLGSLTRRYPGKPLFVEVSVFGTAHRKAAWLAALGQAVDDSSQVYALLYHQGGPELKPTPAQVKSWSLASDPASLATWKQVLTSLHTGGPDGKLCRTAGRRGVSPGGGTLHLVAMAAHRNSGPAGHSLPYYAA